MLAQTHSHMSKKRLDNSDGLRRDDDKLKPLILALRSIVYPIKNVW